MSKNTSITQNYSFKKRLRYSMKKLTGYKYVNDYNNTTMKECKNYDDENNYLYDKNIKLFNRTSKMLEKNNALFEYPKPPAPPRSPSNVELFVIFKRRKEKTDNKLQTLAVIYLLKNNYSINIDPDISLLNNLDGMFEPYQAIELAEKVANSKYENFVQHTLEYINQNKIMLKDQPEDKSVKQKIAYYNFKNNKIRRKSDTSLGRERSNSDTYLIEERANQRLREEKEDEFQTRHHDGIQLEMKEITRKRASTLSNVVSAQNLSKSNPNLYRSDIPIRVEINNTLPSGVASSMPARQSSENTTRPSSITGFDNFSVPEPSAPPDTNPEPRQYKEGYNIFSRSISKTSQPPAYC